MNDKPPVERVDEVSPPPGDSREQQEAEATMVALLGARLGIALAPRRIELNGGVRVELDAASDDLSVLVEAWAHQGPVKSAQRNKVLTDAFKLAFLAQELGRPVRLILLLSDEEAARRFQAGWAAAALARFNIELAIVELSPAGRQRIRDAQARQYR
jgi:hypothetical protein